VWSDRRAALYFLFKLAGIAATYFVLAKLGLRLASINPSATPIWPPTGLAIAAVLLWGEQVWPAIFIAAFAANATTAGTLETSLCIGAGNTLEGVAGGYFVGLLGDRRTVFSTPSGIARFAGIAAGLATVISASVGVATLCLAGLASWTQFTSIWMTWWVGDVAGALVVTPVIVLWAVSGLHGVQRRELIESGALFATTVAVGVLAFTPILQGWVDRAPFGFLTIVPRSHSCCAASRSSVRSPMAARSGRCRSINHSCCS
jgi:integral membrane sensor domain MASE1